MNKMMISAAALAFALSASQASAATFNLVGVSDASNTATVDFNYNAATFELTIGILNTSTSGPDPRITGFAFNAPTNVTGGTLAVSGTANNSDWTAEFDSNGIDTPGNYGFFDVAGLTGPSFNGGSPNSGIVVNTTGTFVFTLSGTGLGSLTTDSFLSLFSDPGNENSSTQFFAARFQRTGLDEEGSDVAIPGEPPVIPLPAAGWLLLAGVGGLAAMRRRKMAA
jgi:hypothetical protein